MKVSISNIAWEAQYDENVYKLFQQNDIHGLEIAPTRVFPTEPYMKLKEGKEWSEKLKLKYNLNISSMQSIWYGRTENIFGSDEERQKLLAYTKKAIDFASVIACPNLVFGCPKNRIKSDNVSEQIAIEFFKAIGDYAYSKGTVIGIEANPTIYNTNYINSTIEALQLIEKVNSKGFLLNLDVGTIIYNKEDIAILADKISLINHVHISEPQLVPIKQRHLHNQINEILQNGEYNKFISIEMKRVEKIEEIKTIVEYVKKVFNN